MPLVCMDGSRSVSSVRWFVGYGIVTENEGVKVESCGRASKGQGRAA